MHNMNLKKGIQTIGWIIPLILLIMVSCEKEVFEPVIIPNDDVSYATDIQSIWDASCTSCHPPSKGLDLTATVSYDALVPDFVEPADSVSPEESPLYRKLTGTSHESRTSPVDKQVILKWITQGVPNN
jgi:hypothetical protein